MAHCKNSPLIKAISNGNEEIVELLLNKDVNHRAKFVFLGYSFFSKETCRLRIAALYQAIPFPPIS